MTMDFEEGVYIGIEASPVGLRGLTHREVGDHTQAKVILMETANPMMDYVRGKATEELVLRGKMNSCSWSQKRTGERTF